MSKKDKKIKKLQKALDYSEMMRNYHEEESNKYFDRMVDAQLDNKKTIEVVAAILREMQG